MTNGIAQACMAAFSVLILAAVACGTRQQSAERTAVRYPEPRFPSYLKPPASVDEVMPHVRPLARNKIGFQGNGLGIAQAGDTVVFILPATAEDMIVQAVKRAMEERGVKVNLVPEYEVAGVSRDDAAAFEKARRTFTSEQGYMEATWWVEANFHDPDRVKDWLKGRRPDLYDKLFPKNRELSPHLEEVRRKFLWENVGKGIQAYLTAHPPSTEIVAFAYVGFDPDPASQWLGQNLDNGYFVRAASHYQRIEDILRLG